MTESPHPLTPPDCDLRHFRDMPLDVGRLRDSHLITHEDPEAIVAALLLWGVAWHQVPSASLPDDDRLLAKYAGYGRSLDTWEKVKAGAMRGFVRCSDGRLYHRTLAEKANEAWTRHLRYSWEKAKDRHRKDQKKLPESERSEFPDFDDWLAGRPASIPPARRQGDLPLEGPAVSGGTLPERAPARTERARHGPARTGARSEPDDLSGGNGDEFQRNDDEIPPENALKGKERKGKESESTQPTSSHDQPAGEEPPRDGSGREDQPDQGPGRLADADLKVKLDAVLDAAGWHPRSPAAIDRALTQVEEWTKAGVDFDDVVIPSIKAVVAETSEPTRTLGRFRARIDHEHARRKARNGSGRDYTPPKSPNLAPEDEDPQFRPFRQRLLDHFGPQLFSLLINDVRFSAELQGDRRLLAVNGREYMTEVVVNGLNAPAVRKAAREAGFADIWKGR